MRSGSDRKAKIFFSRKMDFVFLKKLRRKKVQGTGNRFLCGVVEGKDWGVGGRDKVKGAKENFWGFVYANLEQ
jgi:hypothetical protein